MRVRYNIPVRAAWQGELPSDEKTRIERAIFLAIEQAIKSTAERGSEIMGAESRGVENYADRFAPSRYRADTRTYGMPSYDKGGETVTVSVTGETQPDPWAKLSAEGRKKAQDLNDECWRWIKGIGGAEMAHMSELRAGWMNGLANRRLVEISNLDSDDEIEEVSIALTRHTNFIAINVIKFREEWRTVETRYNEEYRWLLSQKSTDTTEAAKRIEELYRQTKSWLDRGAINYITDEDYFELKETLDKGKHIALGILRASRIRAKKLKDMMEVVADLRRHGEDAEKFVPNWSRRVLEEVDHLDVLSKNTSEGFAPESLAEFSNLGNELLRKRKEALEAHPPEKSILEKGVDLIAGGAEAVTGIFVEAAKEAVDLVQISLHISSLGKYEPKFISDIAKAAEQGATTSELLKGMATGIIETPSRFLKACEDGDWEAIGRETVNLYFLAKTLKESPELVKNLSKTAVAITNRALRILRARTVALEISSEARLLPPGRTAETRAAIRAKAPKGISEETVSMLEKNPELLEALAKNPRAARALTLCKSLCIKEFVSAEQVKRIEGLMADAERRGLQIDMARVNEYFHRAVNQADLTQAIDDFQAAMRKATPSGAAPTGEAIMDEAELLQQRGVRRSPEIELAAKEGREFDVLEGQKYPHNQVPVRDLGGKVRRLDSYDPQANEIISRKSLATHNGQIAFTSEGEMIRHFQEFALKYPNGAVIADTPAAQKLGLANQTLTGKYILEVPVQEWAIPDLILNEAKIRGITIRDIKGRIYK